MFISMSTKHKPLNPNLFSKEPKFSTNQTLKIFDRKFYMKLAKILLNTTQRNSSNFKKNKNRISQSLKRISSFDRMNRNTILLLIISLQLILLLGVSNKFSKGSFIPSLICLENLEDIKTLSAC